jgi:hypothetical protein
MIGENINSSSHAVLDGEVLDPNISPPETHGLALIIVMICCIFVLLLLFVIT